MKRGLRTGMMAVIFGIGTLAILGLLYPDTAKKEFAAIAALAGIVGAIAVDIIMAHLFRKGGQDENGS